MLEAGIRDLKFLMLLYDYKLCAALLFCFHIINSMFWFLKSAFIAASSFDYFAIDNDITMLFVQQNYEISRWNEPVFEMPDKGIFFLAYQFP